MSDWVVLTFSPNSIRNCTITLGPGGPAIYILTTDVKTHSKTQVVDAQTKALVALLERNEILPDTIKFTSRNEGKKSRVSKWLVSGKTPDKFPVTFMETNLGRCTWKSDPSNRLALFGPDDKEYASPLVFIRTEPSQQLSLLIHSKILAGQRLDPSNQGALEIINPLLLAVIYLEGKLRGGDKPASHSQGVAQEAFISTAFGT